MRLQKLGYIAIVSMLLMFSWTIVQAEELVHVVVPGENLYRIALRYGVTVNAIAEENDIINTERVSVGQQLIIPSLSVPDESAEVVNPLVAAPPISHTIRQGETLDSIARRYGIGTEEIILANNLTGNTVLNEGYVLQIWGAIPAVPASVDINQLAMSHAGEAPSEAAVAETSVAVSEEIPTRVHVVRFGETLSQIADQYGLTWLDLAEANGITSIDRIFEGTELVIPDPETVSAPVAVENTSTDENIVVDDSGELESVTETEEPQTVVHIVKAGETLSQIAMQYGVSMASILSENNILNPDTIHIGTPLTVPEAMHNITTYVNAVPEIDPGAHVGIGRELVVDLSDSTIYAYEDGELVHAALASTGLPATPTVKGDFKVYNKLESQTMSGPGYYLPGVESVMYFYAGYAVHGTYWHNNFGQPMSHGCVNLPNHEAKWFYDFASVGTPVHVQA